MARNDQERMQRHAFELAVSLILKALLSCAPYEQEVMQKVIEDLASGVLKRSGNEGTAFAAAVKHELIGIFGEPDAGA